jgi:hypothetical protein
MFDIGALELLVLVALMAVVVWLLLRRRGR